MIHYHGTPIKPPLAGLKALTGRHALIPFYDPQQVEMAADVCQSFVLDNGAFVCWRRGVEVVWSDYYRWAEKWLKCPSCDWALIPDIITGTETENDALLKEWPLGTRGVPVWHLHESLERLRNLSFAWPIVAIGSSGKWSHPGTTAWWGRMAEAMETVCDDGVPRCGLHGLRMLSVRIFPCLPLKSADATTVARKSFRDSEWRGGNQPHADEIRAIVLAERIEAFQSARIWDGSVPVQIGLEISA